MRVLSTTQLGAMTSDQANNLTSVQLGALNTSQLATLTAIAGVTTSTLAAPYTVSPTALSTQSGGNWAGLIASQSVVNGQLHGADMVATLASFAAGSSTNGMVLPNANIGITDEGNGGGGGLQSMVQTLGLFDANGSLGNTPIRTASTDQGTGLLGTKSVIEQGIIALGKS